MRLSEHLYLGEKAGKQRFSVLQSLRNGKVRNDVYVITPPENEKQILTVYPAFMFGSAHLKEKNPLILGLAVGRAETLEVLRQMVEESYRKTGGFRPAEWKG